VPGSIRRARQIARTLTGEDIRYQAAALRATNKKAEKVDSVTSRSASSKTAKVILNDTEAVIVTGTPAL